MNQNLDTEIRKMLEFAWRLAKRRANTKDTLQSFRRVLQETSDAVVREIESLGYEVAVSPAGFSWRRAEKFDTPAALAETAANA